MGGGQAGALCGSVAKTEGWRFDTLERCPSPRLNHSNGALSRRRDPTLRPLVFALSDLLPPDVGDDAGAGFRDRSELYLEMGSAVWAGTGEALPSASEAHQ